MASWANKEITKTTASRNKNVTKTAVLEEKRFISRAPPQNERTIEDKATTNLNITNTAGCRGLPSLSDMWKSFCDRLCYGTSWGRGVFAHFCVMFLFWLELTLVRLRWWLFFGGDRAGLVVFSFCDAAVLICGASRCGAVLVTVLSCDVPVVFVSHHLSSFPSYLILWRENICCRSCSRLFQWSVAQSRD